MKAGEIQLLQFLGGVKQFRIPIYQRKYSWEEEQCERLFEDIIKAGTAISPSHFFGSIVYVTDSDGTATITGVDHWLVIDGQQRLTTIMLLLHALETAAKNTNQVIKNVKESKIRNIYLTNPEEEGEDVRKIVLTEPDKDTLYSILDGIPIPDIYSERILENVKYFEDRINQSSASLDEIWGGLLKLKIVAVALTPPEDDPQLIFESLNSTGLNLAEADKIRNYLLMGVNGEEQEELYKKFWYPMEQRFEKGKDFDRFMKDFLTVMQTDIPTERDVYMKFKEYFVEEEKKNSECVEELNYYSEFFSWLQGKAEDEEIKEEIENINILRVKPAYPFLLQVFSDYNKGIILKNDVLDIMNVIQSYVYRRQIVGGTGTSGHNKTFAILYRHVDKENAQKYVDSIKAFFILQKKYKRFPLDEEFREDFHKANVYDLKSCNYMLLRLENGDRTKEKIKSDDVSIEHIMPQNKQLSKSWQEDLGEDWRQIQEKYLHTVGNLTITGLNSEMSDKSFKEKIDIAFKKTPYQLSAGLRQIENWNEEEIKKRGSELVNLALKTWKFPELSEEVLKKYRSQFDSSEDLDEEYDEEDEEEDVRGWENKRNGADKRIIKIQDEFIKNVEEKFDCVAMPQRKYLYFYTKEGWETKRRDIRTCFLVLNCGKETFRAFFRVDPTTYNNSPNLDSWSSDKGRFFKHGNETERRMRVGWLYDGVGDRIPECLEQLEHAYHTTKEQLNYKN